MFGTLRWRLTLLYGATAMVMLLLLSLVPVFVYLTGRPNLPQERIAEVRVVASQAERALLESGSPALAVGLVEQEEIWVVVRDGEGQPLVASSGYSSLPEVEAESAEYPEVERTGDYMVTSLEVRSPPAASIQVYGEVPGDEDPLVGRFLVVQAAFVVLAILLLAVLGPALAMAALKPLRRVSSVAEQLSRGKLGSRVDLPELKERQDEVGEVAASFDAMAESLEERFEAEREYRESLRRFLADASHELRTPLTSILGYLDVLEEGGDRDPAVRQRALSVIREESGRMAHLVRDLLALARLESHQETLSQPVDLCEVALEAVKSYPGRDIPVRCPEPVVVDTDSDAMLGVVSNLLSNAVDHTLPEQAVRVEIRREGVEAVLSVSDEGTGIPAEDLPRVFERFYRAGDSGGRDGAGLGLAIVKETVEASGGSVGVESVPGQGSSFTVRLPLSDKS
ncbi:MAG: ATP-binding protein [Rubrobacteraceae bacterium]